MKERGILFSGEMVRALLAGTKTQTRRAVKLRANDGVQVDHEPWRYTERAPDGRHLWQHRKDIRRMIIERCPYGAIGDRLWVRETWCCEYEDDCPTDRVLYRATETRPIVGVGERADGSERSPWRPSIHLRRVDARITLEITNVRVQRLHDISEEDARAEGCPSMIETLAGLSHLRGADAVAAVPTHITTARDEYALLWERINGDGSWATNPWVWALTFKRVDAARAAA